MADTTSDFHENSHHAALIPGPEEIIPHLVGYTVKEIERDLILNTLAVHSGNRTLTANILGIAVRTLRNKINEYSAQGIDIPEPEHVRQAEAASEEEEESCEAEDGEG